jgi:hypothetical protein
MHIYCVINVSIYTLQQYTESYSDDTWCKGQSKKRTPQKTHNNHVVVCSISVLDLLCCVPHGMQLCLGLVLHVCMWCALNCHSCLLLMMFWCCVCVCVCVYVCEGRCGLALRARMRQPPQGQPSPCLCVRRLLDNNQIMMLPAGAFRGLRLLRFLWEAPCVFVFVSLCVLICQCVGLMCRIMSSLMIVDDVAYLFGKALGHTEKCG